MFNSIITDTAEYLSYYDYNVQKIFTLNLASGDICDSVNIVFDKNQKEKYGNINSFCFNGQDSLFLLLDYGLFFVKNKALEKIIPINDLDSLQYNSFRFQNLQNAPIYFDKINGEIIGQTYCSTCYMHHKNFYEQKILSAISLNTNKFRFFNLTYPDSYLKSYYGFANSVYIENTDSFSYVSVPADPKIFKVNRIANSVDGFEAGSSYQKGNAKSLDTVFADNREEKMRHFTTIPYYAEMRFDAIRKYLYRFFLKEISIKNSEGKHNTFINKPMYLMVLNEQNEVAGEFELNKYYALTLSFAGRKGFYIRYISPNKEDSGKMVFKILNFK